MLALPSQTITLVQCPPVISKEHRNSPYLPVQLCSVLLRIAVYFEPSLESRQLAVGDKISLSDELIITSMIGNVIRHQRRI